MSIQMADNNIQKIENSLNLALSATAEERKQSMNLNVGYQEEEQMWEVVVKYSGGNMELNTEEYRITYLLNEYAIVLASEEKIKEMATLPQIEYIEKPKRLYFVRDIGKVESCIGRVLESPLGLSGRGVIIGVLDSGIDYRGVEFQNADGTTRILNIWDQSIEGNPPRGYQRGSEYTGEDIDKGNIPTQDTSGHGTEVTAVAAGKGGVAPRADIMVVKLGASQKDGFPRTTELMQGLDYLVKKAKEYRQPIAINISFGNTYGSHDGTSLLERFIDDIANYWKSVICIGMGNEGNASGHVQGNLSVGEIKYVELSVDKRQVSFDLQLWKPYEDVLKIALIAPWGERIGPLLNQLGVQRYVAGTTEILLYYGEPNPYSVLQEIYFEFIAQESYVETGIWKIELQAERIVTGEYSMWLPSSVALNQGTQFNQATPRGTVTIPATASRAISIGAYDGRTITYADFSGRGSSDNIRLVKPDIVAPGVGVQTITTGGLVRFVSGTSYATPFVTGGAALLMEWGIVDGNDPYLYGEKVKSYIRKGGKNILGDYIYPNEAVGYGRLCLGDSFPF